jgi:hypothetical protein
MKFGPDLVTSHSPCPISDNTDRLERDARSGGRPNRPFSRCFPREGRGLSRSYSGSRYVIEAGSVARVDTVVARARVHLVGALAGDDLVVATAAFEVQ